jgi:hypothetical protein
MRASAFELRSKICAMNTSLLPVVCPHASGASRQVIDYPKIHEPGFAELKKRYKIPCIKSNRKQTHGSRRFNITILGRAANLTGTFDPLDTFDARELHSVPSVSGRIQIVALEELCLIPDRSINAC